MTNEEIQAELDLENQEELEKLAKIEPKLEEILDSEATDDIVIDFIETNKMDFVGSELADTTLNMFAEANIQKDRCEKLIDHIRHFGL